MSDESFEPREHDHLVEPIYAGIEARRRPRSGLLRRMLAWIGSFFSRTRPRA